jgi:hypothetical protein
VNLSQRQKKLESRGGSATELRCNFYLPSTLQNKLTPMLKMSTSRRPLRYRNRNRMLLCPFLNLYGRYSLAIPMRDSLEQEAVLV